MSKARIELTAEDRTRAAFASAERNFTQLERAGAGLSGKLSVLGGAGGLGAGVALTFAAIARNAVSSAAQLDDLAESTGGTVEGLSRLVDVARIGGKGIEEVETALVRLTKALAGSDEESKGAAAAFKAIGLSVADLKALSPDQALERVAQAFSGFADGAGKTAIALEIFGRSGAQLLPLMKDIATESERAASLTADQAAQAEELEKKWNRLVVAAGNLGREMVLNVVNVLSTLDERKAEETMFDRLTNSFNRLIANWEDKRATFLEFIGATDTAARARAEAASARRAIAENQADRDRAALNAAGDQPVLLPSLPVLPPSRPPPRPVSDKGREAANRAKQLAAERQRMIEIGQRNLAASIDSEEEMRELVARRAMDDARKLAVVLESGPNAQLERQRQTMQLLAQQYEDGAISAEQFTDAAAGQLGLVASKTEQSTSLVQELGLTFTSAFEDAISSGNGLRGILGGIEQDLIRVATRKLVTEPFSDFMSGIAGGIAKNGINGGAIGDFVVSLFGAAKGAAFGPAGVYAFASGGIVDSPTPFRFGPGGARRGVMGEAGPEAVMPLKRGRDGKLGVAGGGTTVLNINVSTPDATSFVSSQGQVAAAAARLLARARRNM